MDPVTSVLLVIFGGIGGTLLWEGFLAPWRTRRRLARTLMQEISLNLEFIGVTTEALLQDKQIIPGDYRLVGRRIGSFVRYMGSVARPA